jgi:uncharacterized protein DUF3568
LQHTPGVNAVARGLRLLALLLAAAALPGCAALALPAVGGAMLSAGADVVKAGTEYSSNGTAYRTFAAGLDDVRGAMLDTFHDLQIEVQEDAEIEHGGRIKASTDRRRIEVRLEEITPVVTRVRLVVGQSFFRKDRSTASAIITLTEQALAAAVPSALPAAALEAERCLDQR